MAGTFKIVPASGGWRVHFSDGNHRLIFWTQVYKTHASAKHAAEVTKAQASTARIIG